MSAVSRSSARFVFNVPAERLAGEEAHVSPFQVALARAGADGYAGCISATVNVAPSLSAKLWSNRDDMSVLEEVRSVRMGVSAQPIIPAVKFLVGRIHRDAGFERLLPPHLELTDDQKSALAQIEAAVA